MSQQMVAIVVDRLVTDEELRVRFALDPIETLAELTLEELGPAGFGLTRDEIDGLMKTDVRVWVPGAWAVGERAH